MNHFRALTATVCAALFFLANTANSQVAPTSDAVYQQFGEKTGIDKVVADFLPLLLADNRIKDSFKDADMERLGNLLAEQFCQLTGGPCAYSGKEMREVHKDMKLNKETGSYTHGAINWDEFFDVIKGNGPCNAKRLKARVDADKAGAWVREAATAYAEKKMKEKQVA